MLTTVAVLAGLVAAGIGALSLADALTATGLPDPGPATTAGLPFVRAAGEIAGVIAVGGFCSRRSLCRRRRTGCSTPPGTGRCGWRPWPPGCGPSAPYCWCR